MRVDGGGDSRGRSRETGSASGGTTTGRGGGDVGTRGAETTTSAASSASGNGANVFNMEHLRAAVDRHHKHISNEVERAWKESSKTFGGSFSFGGAGGGAGVGGALERDSDDAEGAREAASHRAGRRKTLSVSAFAAMARRASQDSLAKLDDAKFMERLDRLRKRGSRRFSGSDEDGDDVARGDSRSARTSPQDLQALIAKGMSKAPSLPKWGEEWDVFKAISTNFKSAEAEPLGRPRTLNRRRAQSETISTSAPIVTSPRAAAVKATAAPEPTTSSSMTRDASPPRALSRSESFGEDTFRAVAKTSEQTTPRDESERENVFENIKKEITSRLPRPPSLPKMTTDLQNAVRRLAGKPEEITVSSPYDADLSSPGVVLKRSSSKEEIRAAEMEAKDARAARGKDAPRSVREPGRSVAIVTTAALPWMTGTAVNPLLRAAYLARRGLHDVTLVIPFLAPSEQKIIHPNMIFNTPEEQAEYVNKWVEERCGFKPQMKLSFYPGRYATDKYSIIPVGDLTKYVPGDRDSDIAVLEEPEHLNWYHSGERWTDKFKHVVGIVHTNYLDYVRLEENGDVKEKALKFVNNVVSSVHCHKVIKLSDAVQEFPKSTTMNVHGVSPIFLDVGAKKAEEATTRTSDVDMVKGPLASIGRASTQRNIASAKADTPVFSKGAYFLGKVVWGKGYKELLDRVSEHNGSESGRDCPLELDVFGNGDDFTEVKTSAEKMKLPLHFHGRKDHAAKDIHDYKVFVNPSLSDVVATTTAEALAMGKFVVCAKHPSNEFFSTFPNCLVYDNPKEFSECVTKALTTEPQPLSAKDSYRLSWEAATDRFLDAAELSPKQVNPSLGDKVKEKFAHTVHAALTSIEPIRRATGAGSNTLAVPEKLDASWVPEPWDSSARDSHRSSK